MTTLTADLVTSMYPKCRRNQNAPHQLAPLGTSQMTCDKCGALFTLTVTGPDSINVTMKL